MSVDYTSVRLLARIRLKSGLPSATDPSTGAFTDSDLLGLIDDSVSSYLLPLIRRVNERYLVTSDTITIVSGTAGYRIPTRSVASTIKDVQVLVGSRDVSLPRIEPILATNYSGGNWASTSSLGYSLNSNTITLLPTPTAAGTMLIFYERRCNSLIAAANAVPITIIASNVYTFASQTYLGTSGTTSTDFILAPPGFDIMAASLSGTVTATAFTPAAAVSGISVGDYIALAGDSPVLNLPAELYPLVESKTIVTVMEARRDPGLTNAQALLREQEKNAVVLIGKRTEGIPRLIVNRFGPGGARGPYWPVRGY